MILIRHHTDQRGADLVTPAEALRELEPLPDDVEIVVHIEAYRFNLRRLLACEARKNHWTRVAKRRGRELRRKDRTGVYREALWWSTSIFAARTLDVALNDCASVGVWRYDRWRAAMAPAWWYPLQRRIAAHLMRLHAEEERRR